MAQTGFTPISTYYTTTAGATPTAGNLVNGELALNIHTSDGKLFYKDSAGVVQVLASKATGTVAGSTTQVIYNNAGAYAGSANFTFNGTTVTIANDASISGLTVGKGGSSVSTNTVVGNGALAVNTTGYENSVFGYTSLASNTTGSDNTAIGRAAMFTNTTGFLNTAIGALSLYYNTTGAYNVALGMAALQANTTASNNTAVGYQAGYSNTTGTLNSYFGWSAGRVDTGSYNSYIGSGAGYYMTSGSKNTILGGYNGNQGGLDIRTASNYIVLSDGDGNPRGIFDSTGNFGVGITPSSAIHANGQIRSSGTEARAFYVYGASGVKPYITINEFGVRDWDVSAGKYSSGTFAIQSGSVNGVYLGATATAWASASDERLKDIIEPITDAVSKVSNLRSVIGKYKTDEDGVRRSFLIAQDIQKEFPEALEASNPDRLGVQYADVIPLLVSAIKELNAKLEAQALEIATLKAK